MEISTTPRNREYSDNHQSNLKDKLVGRAESIHPQRKWCNGDFPVCGKASTEVRDRTSARAVPRSR